MVMEGAEVWRRSSSAVDALDVFGNVAAGHYSEIQCTAAECGIEADAAGQQGALRLHQLLLGGGDIPEHIQGTNSR